MDYLQNLSKYEVHYIIRVIFKNNQAIPILGMICPLEPRSMSIMKEQGNWQASPWSISMRKKWKSSVNERWGFKGQKFVPMLGVQLSQVGTAIT